MIPYKNMRKHEPFSREKIIKETYRKLTQMLHFTDKDFFFNIIYLAALSLRCSMRYL